VNPGKKMHQTSCGAIRTVHLKIETIMHRKQLESTKGNEQLTMNNEQLSISNEQRSEIINDEVLTERNRTSLIINEVRC
jgi:hypothetical protein